MESNDARNSRRISRGPVIVLLAGGALALGLVLFGAAMAGAPAPTPPPDERPGTAEQPRPVNVILRDYRFDPTPLYLHAGETVELRVVNGGLIEHELVLGDAEVQAAWALADAQATPPAAFATAPPASVEPGVGGLRVLLGSGGSTSVRYEVPADQQLQLICHLPGHAERGMIGRVELVESSAVTR